MPPSWQGRISNSHMCISQLITFAVTLYNVYILRREDSIQIIRNNISISLLAQIQDDRHTAYYSNTVLPGIIPAIIFQV